MTPLFKSIHEGKKFLIMNLVISEGENLWKQKPIGWKKLFFPSCESMTFNAKSKAFISKTKGFVGSTWIKSGAVVKKTLKNWKAFFTLTPHEKGWFFRIKRIRGSIIIE